MEIGADFGADFGTDIGAGAGWLVLVTLGTSALSGVFGMAGGLLLMGALAGAMPVEAAIALHGITQGAATGARAGLLWRHVHGRALLAYAGGALAAWGLLSWARPAPELRQVWLILGLLPFAAEGIGRIGALPDLARHPAWGAVAGLLVNGLQGIAGVAGPILDLFFVQANRSGAMPGREVVATKAATQALSHGLKVLLYLDAARRLPPALIPATLLAALLGTVLGTRLLAALPERDFRRGTRAILLAVGAYYLWRGAGDAP